MIAEAGDELTFRRPAFARNVIGEPEQNLVRYWDKGRVRCPGHRFDVRRRHKVQSFNGAERRIEQGDVPFSRHDAEEMLVENAGQHTGPDELFMNFEREGMFVQNRGRRQR